MTDKTHILAIIIAAIGFLIGYSLVLGIKKQIEIDNEILAIGFKKYPQCATAYWQHDCIKGLELAERKQMTKEHERKQLCQ